MFKLAKEAKQFFPKFADKIKPIEFWEKQGIHNNLLVECEPVFVKHGIEINSGYTRTSGWESENIDGIPMSKFHFTVFILDSSNQEYKSINTEELLDNIQQSINSYVKNFRSKQKM